MQIEDMLIDENSVIKVAVERLETVRCKIIYVVRDGKLVAAISDGDIRRYVLKEGDTSLSVTYIANYNPAYIVSYEKEKLEEIFRAREVYSIPVVNYNHEVVEIVFRDGRRIKRALMLDCPVVMMAGGKGNRLYPYTQILPKALIPVGEIPISERIINNFFDLGCRQFYMVVNHKKNMIRAYFDNINRNYNLVYVEEEKPLGTGGGLYLLQNKIKQDFFLINCDVIVDADYGEIYNYHKNNENFITIVAAKYHFVVPYGVILSNTNNNFQSIQEKPELNYLINTGMYVVSEALIKSMPHNEMVSFPELIDYSQKKGKKIGVYIVEESAYMDMGQLEELEKMKEKLNV